VTRPAPETLLRHREPALLLGAIDSFAGDTLRCTGRDAGPWRWPRMLEAAAQTAGLLGGLRETGIRNTAVVAEYRSVRVHVARHDGPVVLVARLDRRILRFRRCRIEVRAVDGTVLLDGSVTIAPGTASIDLDVPAADPRLYAVLAEAGFRDGPFGPGQHRSCALVDRYVVELAVALVDALGLRTLLAAPQTVASLTTARGFAPSFGRPLRWLLGWLAEAGMVTPHEPWQLTDPGRPAHVPELRRAVLDADPSYAPTVALLDEAAAAYPRVASGETTGERALFQRTSLWATYFDNRNAYYALNNRVAAAAAAARLPAARARVLEIGAGLGSATVALLALPGVAGRIGVYRLTEPVPFFRRRAERTIRDAHPALPLACSSLDLNAAWTEPAGAADLVWGVNVFHLARDLDATLRAAYDALAPGGWLVAGEGIRPFAGRPVAAELPFQLLDAFSDVALDPATRPEAGFLTAEHWIAAFARAGFTEVALVPDAIRLRELHPTLLAAAVCGRRP